MFDILEADIICFQETKIQRKDLEAPMVLVPGFDCYWSLPRYKKGYSGVVVYTRNSKCAPIRAEEGIAGGLCPPNSTTPFRDLPEDQQIGGYPTLEQMSESEFDAAALDAEGRCVILEFPAFVLIGTYCPAERDETRTHFRTAFLKVLDSRIRNLVKMGKRVVWIGDLNISREEIDTAMADEMMRKNGVDHVGWISTPARRMFNQLLVGGKVHGERDEGRENQIMWDVCRSFHEGRIGMYTCWETKVNARPGNFGARIDYVVCTYNMKDWWSDANIQEGLMGSDHCPVYGVLKEKIEIDGQEKHTLDLMNPEGMFVNGQRQIEWSNKHLLPMSGKLIPEFDRRRNIKDMFAMKPSLPKPTSTLTERDESRSRTPSPTKSNGPVRSQPSPAQDNKSNNLKRTISSTSSMSTSKKSKQDTSNGQKTLTGFFAPKNPPKPATPVKAAAPEPYTELEDDRDFPLTSPEKLIEDEAASVETKKSWNSLFAKPVLPKCQHDEPCKIMLTKKPGVNNGRSFYMCQRPLGPSGKQGVGGESEWRCQTFIWRSDHDARKAAQ